VDERLEHDRLTTIIEGFHLNRALFVLLCALLATSCANLRPLSKPQLASKPLKTPQIIEPQPPKFELCPMLATQLDPESLPELWQRVALQSHLDIPHNKRVAAQKNWYLKHPKYLTRVSKRAQPYLYFITTEIEKRGLPLELALLPIVESAYDPFAYSHGRASGMWQFIPGTGKGYGLKQNWWYDGRRDIFLSTHAALDYLSYLNKRFKGNWLHALAAYNSGQGNVNKAIRRNKKAGKATDFWSLKLPKETKAYVPKLLALAEILKNQSNEDSPWYPLKNEPYFARVDSKAQIDLTLAAELSDINMQTFYQLNPAFNQWATPPRGPHFLLLPIDKVALFNSNLNKIPAKERIAFKRYTIKEGDSLSQIAHRFSTSVSLLKMHNRIRGNNIRVGHTLMIPTATKTRDRYLKSTNQRLIAKQNRHRSGRKLAIRVQSGDSFWTLSRRYKVNLRQLASWNNMAPTDPLKIGQKLVLWSKTTKLASAAGLNQQKRTKKIRYKVRNGDSFARIADKFNVSLAKIKRWNHALSGKKYLQPGQSLTLFVDITRQF